MPLTLSLWQILCKDLLDCCLNTTMGLETPQYFLGTWVAALLIIGDKFTLIDQTDHTSHPS